MLRLNFGGIGSYPHREVGYMPNKGPAIRLELAPKEGDDRNQTGFQPLRLGAYATVSTQGLF